MPDPATALTGIGIGSSLYFADQTSDAASDASAAQLQTAREAEALNRERFGTATDLLSPYIEDSRTAQNQLMIEQGLAPGEAGTAYLESPAYQSLLSERQRGVDQAAANSGHLYSGRRLENAGDVSENTQSQFYTNYMNLLTNMANPTAATNLASMGVNQGSIIGQQNLSAQQVAGGYDVSAAQTNQAAFGDVVGAGANIYSGYLASGSGGSAGSSYVDPQSIPGYI